MTSFVTLNIAQLTWTYFKFSGDLRLGDISFFSQFAKFIYDMSLIVSFHLLILRAKLLTFFFYRILILKVFS